MKNLIHFCGIMVLILDVTTILAQTTCRCVDGSDQPGLNTLQCEDFEKSTLNSIFPGTNSAKEWALWPGTTQPASIKNAPGSTTNKTLFLEQKAPDGPNLLYKLGNKFLGKYRISWQMYIPKGKTAHYTFQHEENVIKGHLASKVTFTDKGYGFVQIAQDTTTKFSFFVGAWNKIVHIINLDNNTFELWINNEFVDSWNFRLGSTGNTIDTLSNKLGAINFLAIPNAEFYVDNICVQQAMIFGLSNPACLKNGRTVSLFERNLYTANEINAKGNCPRICDFAGINVTNSLKVDNTNNSPLHFSQINKSSILPNSIITNDCVKDIFPLLTSKQLLGQVFTFNSFFDSAHIDFNYNSALLKNIALIVFDCTTSKCIFTRVLDKPQDASFTFSITPERDYTVIILAKKPLNYRFRIWFTISIPNCNPCLNCTTISNELDQFSTLSNQLAGEKSYQFNNEITSNVDISIQSLKEKAFVYLTGSRCSQEVLAYDSTGSNGIANISIQLSAGIYHLIVNQINPSPKTPFSISVVKTPADKVSKSALQNCPTVQNQVHIVSIRGTPLLLDGEALTLQDRIYLTNPRNVNSRESNAFNWNGTELQFNLYPDDPKDALSCGYLENEEIQFTIIRGNSIFAVTPIFQPEDGSQITASNTFKKGGKSLIIGFSAGLKVDNLSFNSLPRLSSYKEIFSTQINSTTSWKLERKNVNSASWLTYTPTTGEGITEIKFEIKVNTSTTARNDTLYLINPAGFYQTMVINQPGCTGPSVQAGNDIQVCAGIEFNLSASGIGDIISWEGLDQNQPRVYSTTATQSTIYTAYALKNGCKDTDQVRITVFPRPVGMLKVINPDKTNKGSISPKITGGTPPYKYTWSKDGVLFSNADSLTVLSSGTYILTVNDANNCSENFGPVKISLTGTQYPELQDYVELYPNPVSKTLNLDFKLPQASSFEIVLLDALGRKVWFKKTQVYFQDHLYIDLSSYPKGFYWVQLRSHWGNLVQKIIRQ